MNDIDHSGTELSGMPVIVRRRLIWYHDMFHAGSPLAQADEHRPLFARPFRDASDPRRRKFDSQYEKACREAERLERAKRYTLSDAWVGRACELYDAVGDPERQPRLLLPDLSDPPGDRGLLDLGALTEGTLAHWLYDTPPTLTEGELAQSLSLEQCKRIVTVYRETAAPIEEFSPRPSANPMLEEFLREGLELRLGCKLTHTQLLVYLHLRACHVDAGRLTVCENCSCVHAAPRARRCGRCRRSPIRPTIRPWHRLVIVEPIPSQRRYVSECQGCGELFSTDRGDVKFCARCQKPAERVRRSRARRAASPPPPAPAA